MAGKQAKLLANADIRRALRLASTTRHAERDRVIVLLSFKAGLRAGEIAHLTWPMVTEPNGQIGRFLALHDRAAKKGSGRVIPLHADLRVALVKLRQAYPSEASVIISERGGAMKPGSIVNWFAGLYRALGLEGCSSHSGRRTFVTRAAKQIFRAGGSLRDVQQLAGHSSINQTQAYIEGDSKAKRRLIELV